MCLLSMSVTKQKCIKPIKNKEPKRLGQRYRKQRGGEGSGEMPRAAEMDIKNRDKENRDKNTRRG